MDPAQDDAVQRLLQRLPPPPESFSPEDVANIREIIAGACGTDHTSSQAHYKYLEACVGRPGFSLVCLQVVTDPSAPLKAKTLACICIRNSVHRHWSSSRDAAGSAIVRDDEKARLRDSLARFLIERCDTPQLQKQLAVTIASIAQKDFPQKWRELPTLLRESLSEAPPQQTERVLLLLHKVLKDLEKGRIGPKRRGFLNLVMEIGPSVFRVAVNALNEFTRTAQEAARNASSGAPIDSLASSFTSSKAGSTALLCLKILRRCFSQGPPDVLQAEGVDRAMKELHSCFGKLQEAKAALPNPLDFQPSELVEEIVLKILEVAKDGQATHPIPFCPFLVPYLDVAFKLVSRGSGEEAPADGSRSPRILISALRLLSNAASEDLYHLPDRNVRITHPTTGAFVELPSVTGSDGPPYIMVGVVMDDGRLKLKTKGGDVIVTKEALRKASQVVSSFFEPIIGDLCRQLIEKYLPMTKDDVENWSDNPERFLISEVRDCGRCAEACRKSWRTTMASCP